MTRPAVLIFAAAVRPADVRALVENLGGTRGPEPDDSTLERDGARVWVDTFPPGDLPYSPDLLRAYAEALGAPPLARAVLQVERHRGSEWLAAEVVLAAARRWPLVIDDFGEEIVTVPEFEERLATRRAGLFEPSGRHDATADRAARTDPVTFVLPTAADPRAVLAVLKSLGVRLHPDATTDACLERGAARVWVTLRPTGEAPANPARAPVYRRTLGEPPFNSVRLDVDDIPGSSGLAVELLETLAASWPVLVEGPEGQLQTLDDVRVRAHTSHLFSP
jgi:hypothetical protein